MVLLATLHDRIERLLGAQIFKLIRFLIAGGTAAASNLLVFTMLVQFTELYYLYASIIAFVLSIAVSFTMQKFWTFRDTPLHDVHTQFARYILVIGTNLVINTTLVYTFVEMFGMWNILAQTFATGIIAILSYFVYQHFVFRDRTPTAEVSTP